MPERAVGGRPLRLGFVASDITPPFTCIKNKLNLYKKEAKSRSPKHSTDALFLDGAISRIYVPALQRPDTDGDFTGILCVSAPAPAAR
jgi:uncharacterized protein YigE (DUF2233 family)